MFLLLLHHLPLDSHIDNEQQHEKITFQKQTTSWNKWGTSDETLELLAEKEAAAQRGADSALKLGGTALHEVRGLLVERVVWVRCVEEEEQPERDAREVQCRRPRLTQDVQANVTFQIDVLCVECSFEL